MFWENFIQLCIENNTKPNPVAAALGISSGAVTRWKNGSIPNDVTLKKIADYFNVSTDYLLYGREKKPAEMDEPKENVVILNRNGKIVRREFTKEEMDVIARMIEGIHSEHDPEL